jgi:hypothetical protein
MPLGIGVPKAKSLNLRSESRIPMEIGVHISGHAALPGTEATFTENVSARGARVISTRRWKINDRVVFSTLAGTFRSIARVAYCQIAPQAGFAVGLEFVEITGSWFVAGLEVSIE